MQLFSLLIGLATVSATDGQVPLHFYHRDQPVLLEPDQAKLAIWSSRGDTGADLERAIRELGLEEARFEQDWGDGLYLFALTEASGTPTIDLETTVELLAQAELGFVTPVFRRNGDSVSVAKAQISVKFEAGTPERTVEATVESYGELLARDWYGLADVYLIEPYTNSAIEALRLANQLRLEEHAVRAAPRFRTFGPGPSTGYIPPDPYFTESWALNNTGQRNPSLPNLDLNGPEVWNLPYGPPSQPFVGSDQVVLLVMDTGVQSAGQCSQTEHPDLAVWRGGNFTTQTPDCGGRPQNRCDNHGTWVAGAAAALMGNRPQPPPQPPLPSVGSVGLAPGVRLASARVFGVNQPPDGAGCGGALAPYIYDAQWVMDALDWAPAFGPGAPLDPLPRVVTNLSANEYGQDEDLEDKYLETWRDGMVHMISAGNIDQFEPVSGGIEYPAGIPGTLAITNLSWAGPPHQLHIIGQLGGSRYGPGVAFTAPGTAIFTTDRTGSDGACPVGGSSFCLMGTDDFAYLTGTSYAAPLTVAVAALVLSVRQDLPSGAVEWVLRETATDLGDPGWDQYFGWGLPQADAAVEFALRAIFFDDFELGDSSRWSAVIP